MIFDVIANVRLTLLNVLLVISSRIVNYGTICLLCAGMSINPRKIAYCSVRICRKVGFSFGLRRLLSGRINQ